MIDDIPKYVGKAGTVGAIGYGLGMVLQPSTDLVMPNGTRIPFSTFAGAACAAGSMVSDVMHDVVLPHILKSERWSNTASATFRGVRQWARCTRRLLLRILDSRASWV